VDYTAFNGGLMMNITTSISSNGLNAMQIVERMNMIKGIKLLLIALSSLILLAGNVSAKAIIYYVHNDHLGTPQILTDDNQQVVWKANYKPFGEAVVDEDPDGDGELVEFNIRLPGQYYDKETGLHYNYFRDYDPALGRYTQSDPIGLAGGLNTYGYVYGNPINKVDPLGLDVKIVTSDPATFKVLSEAYARLNTTKRGMQICGQLENSSDVYEIRPVHQDAFYCPPGTTAPICQGLDKTVFIDPFNNVSLPEAGGLNPGSKAAVLGHELGHAIGDLDDGPNNMNNVNKNENPIRAGLGEPARTGYNVPSINWTPGTK
jgi:RHS repeat-associated protein